MIRNYLKIAWRNLRKNTAFTFINLIGLVIGMTSAGLILLWIQNEVSYDRIYPKTDRLYEVYNSRVLDGKVVSWPFTPKILGATLKAEYPQVQDVARLMNAPSLLAAGERKFKVNSQFTDPGLLSMFDLPLVAGNSSSALNSSNTLVITEAMAKKLFGSTNAVGKTVKLDNSAMFTVSGVLKDLPNNSSFNFECLLPWAYLKTQKRDESSWGSNSVYTYVLLKNGITEQAADKAIRNIIKTHGNDKYTNDLSVFLHPASKWRLYSKFDDKGQVSGGRIETVRLFSLIAAFILLIACINFMNLSTARSEKRAKEVGVRKVAGASKSLLIAQFMAESVLLAGIAGLIALVAIQLSLPGFNLLTGKTLFIPYQSEGFWLMFMAFISITGFLAGSYPAFFLSSFKPIQVLKGTFRSVNSPVTPRKVLVIAQFAFAVALIICTMVVRRQIVYAQNRQTGYNKNNLVYTLMQQDYAQHYEAIRNDLLTSGAVTAVIRTSAPITQMWSNQIGVTWQGGPPDSKQVFNTYHTDGNFVHTMGLTLMQGRDLDYKNYPTDSTGALINEAALKVMQLKHPIGANISIGNDKAHIVGVIKDFILESPYEPVTPMIIGGPHPWYQSINYKLNPAHATADNLQTVERIFKKYSQGYPFEYNFIDTEYASKFNDEQQVGKLAALFSALSIIISCLGLFGLAAYMAQNRVKEIGVRKVLGASVAGITMLLSKDFLKLVMLSFVLAAPIAWWGMHKWLSTYTYHVTLSPWIFIWAGVLTMLVALLTISYQTIRAALANPARSLKSE